MGLLMGAVGALVSAVVGPSTTLAIAAALALIFGLTDIGLLRVPYLVNRRQLPRAWLRSPRGHITYFGFGALLGAGGLTTNPYASSNALLLLAASTGTPLLGAIIGVTYAAGRYLAVATHPASRQSGLGTAWIPAQMAAVIPYRRLVGTLTVLVAIVGGAKVIAFA